MTVTDTSAPAENGQEADQDFRYIGYWGGHEWYSRVVLRDNVRRHEVKRDTRGTVYRRVRGVFYAVDQSGERTETRWDGDDILLHVVTSLHDSLEALTDVDRQRVEANTQLRAAQAEATTARTEAAARRSELVNFKRTVTEGLHEQANRRSYCSEFDDVMEQLGLARRNQRFTAHVSVTVQLDIDVLASNSEDVDDQLDVDQVRAALTRSIRSADLEWEVEDSDPA